MDDDMERRIREKGGDANQRSEQTQQEKQDAIALRRSRKIRRADQDARKVSMYTAEVSELGKIKKKLEPIFEPSVDRSMMRLAGNLSIDFRNLKTLGRHVTNEDAISSYWKPEYETSVLYSHFSDYKREWKRPYVVIKLGPSHGIAISCDINQTLQEWHENDQTFTYYFNPVAYEPRISVPFLGFKHERAFSGGWRIGSKDNAYNFVNDHPGYSRKTFSNRDELIDYVKDIIVEAIIENRNKFLQRLGVRGWKVVATGG